MREPEMTRKPVSLAEMMARETPEAQQRINERTAEIIAEITARKSADHRRRLATLGRQRR